MKMGIQSLSVLASFQLFTVIQYRACRQYCMPWVVSRLDLRMLKSRFEDITLLNLFRTIITFIQTKERTLIRCFKYKVCMCDIWGSVDVSLYIRDVSLYIRATLRTVLKSSSNMPEVDRPIMEMEISRGT